MGFRNNAWATVWEITPVSDTVTRGRISTSRKNKQTGEYEQDFSSFVAFLGTSAAQKAAHLNVKDRIKLGDVDCQTYYNKEKKVTYYNFDIFSFELADEANPNQSNHSGGEMTDFSEIDGTDVDDELPF